jgi:hypothetical protein
MISYLPMGRMGNALFQSAAAIALALRNGCEYSMPSKTSSDFWSPLILPHLINPKWEQGRVDMVIEEPHFHYAPILYSKEWDNRQVILKGYFQSEKHFIDFKDEVIRLFNFPYKKNEGFVSVHIRRTDFIELSQKHPPVTDQWYLEAMNMFQGKKFLFFSDDIQYCKNSFGYRNDCYFSEGNSIEQDLIEMANCEHNILSASTFAWWGGFLNKNEEKKNSIANKMV